MVVRRLRSCNGRSASRGNALSIEIGKSGFEETCLGFFDVVGDAAELHAVGSRMIDDVAGAGIVVAGLPDAADADGIAAVRIQGDRTFARFLHGDPFAFLSPDGGDVGVTVEAEARGLLVEMIPGQLFVRDVAEGVGLVQGTVDERHVCHGRNQR